MVVGYGQMVGGAFNYRGIKETNEQNKELYFANREWQKMLSDTSYQRAAHDLKAAGINPILAGQFGGASSPSSALATMQNPGAALGSMVSSAIDVGRSKAQTEKTKAETALIKANKVIKKALTPSEETMQEIKEAIYDLGKAFAGDKDAQSKMKQQMQQLGFKAKQLKLPPQEMSKIPIKGISPEGKQAIQQHYLKTIIDPLGSRNVQGKINKGLKYYRKVKSWKR